MWEAACQQNPSFWLNITTNVDPIDSASVKINLIAPNFTDNWERYRKLHREINK